MLGHRKILIYKLLDSQKNSRLTQLEISKIAKCDRSYVSKIADLMGISKKRPIMDFRGLLRRPLK